MKKVLWFFKKWLDLNENNNGNIPRKIMFGIAIIIVILLVVL